MTKTLDWSISTDVGTLFFNQDVTPRTLVFMEDNEDTHEDTNETINDDTNENDNEDTDRMDEISGDAIQGFTGFLNEPGNEWRSALYDKQTELGIDTGIKKRETNMYFELE
jgi:hypothetical protein